MDSLKAITLLYELEEQLGVEIPNEAIDRIETLGDVVHELSLLSTDA
jgi:acyl carrier protein